MQSDHSSNSAQTIQVPGGWIYHGGPLPNPVLVSDPASWAPLNETNARAVLAQLASLNTQLFTLNVKANTIMATVADVQAALAANETKEATIIGLLQTEAQTLAATQAQLTAALANPGGADPAALQAVVDKMTADSASMDAAIASVTAPPVTTPPVTPAA